LRRNFRGDDHSGGIARHNFDSDINFEFPDDMIARMASTKIFARLREMEKYSLHILIIRPSAAFRQDPRDILIGIFDVTSFAMHAVLCVDD
jgi:hypothetical protein